MKGSWPFIASIAHVRAVDDLRAWLCTAEPADLLPRGAPKAAGERVQNHVSSRSDLSVCSITLDSFRLPHPPRLRLFPSTPSDDYSTPGTMAHLFFGYSGNVSRYHACVRLAASARLAPTAASMGASLGNARAPATSASPAGNAPAR